MFILPTAMAMLLFIALPVVSVMVQSLFIAHERVIIVVENCGPFGCTDETRVDTEATEELRRNDPLGRFNGVGIYTNRNHLAFAELSEVWATEEGLSGLIRELGDLPFYRALGFTLTYTFFVSPLVIVFGFLIAIGVHSLPGASRGPVIFVSLLPMIVTPLIGSLILFWMIDARGILGASLIYIFDDPDLSLKASPFLTWVTLIVYGTWHNTPFAFIVFYAGLQTVPMDTLESARIDGANKLQQIRYVVIPYLAPLVTFVALMQLMDNFRVFEPIVGFNAQANATSLSWLIFNDLRSQNSQLYGSAASTSMLTIVGVGILLTPVLIRTWRDFNRKN